MYKYYGVTCVRACCARVYVYVQSGVRVNNNMHNI